MNIFYIIDSIRWEWHIWLNDLLNSCFPFWHFVAVFVITANEYDFGINEPCGLIKLARKVFDEKPHYRSVPELIALSWFHLKIKEKVSHWNATVKNIFIKKWFMLSSSNIPWRTFLLWMTLNRGHLKLTYSVRTSVCDFSNFG